MTCDTGRAAPVRHAARRAGSATRAPGVSWISARNTMSVVASELGLTFRAATPADVPAVVALVESAYRGEASRAGWTTEADLLDGQRTDPEAVADIVARPNARVVLATTADGTLLGCCQLEQRTGDTCYFGMFAVSPTLQSGGIGGALLAEAERIAAAEWGARRMQMTVLTQRRD